MHVINVQNELSTSKLHAVHFDYHLGQFWWFCGEIKKSMDGHHFEVVT